MAGKESRRFRRDGVTVVELAGSPEEIGRAHGALLRDEVRRGCFELIEGRIIPGLAMELFGADDGRAAGFRDWCFEKAKRFSRQMAPAFDAEISALAKEAGIGLDEARFAQVLVDVAEQAGLVHSQRLFHACTHLAVLPERAGGRVLVGRNLDWPSFGMAQELCALFHYLPDDGIPFWSLGWAGTIGSLTAVNREMLSVTEESLTVTGDVSDEGVPTFLLHRQIAQTQSTMDGAIGLLRSSPRTNGYHTLFASGRERTARVVLHGATSSSVRLPRGGFCLGVQTERTADQYEDGRMPAAEVPLTDETSDFRYRRLRDLIAEHGGDATAAHVMAWLSDDVDVATGERAGNLNCLSNETTLQSLVADLTSGDLFVAMGSIPAPSGGYVKFSIGGDRAA